MDTHVELDGRTAITSRPGIPAQLPADDASDSATAVLMPHPTAQLVACSTAAFSTVAGAR